MFANNQSTASKGCMVSELFSVWMQLKSKKNSRLVINCSLKRLVHRDYTWSKLNVVTDSEVATPSVRILQQVWFASTATLSGCCGCDDIIVSTRSIHLTRRTPEQTRMTREKDTGKDKTAFTLIT